MDNETRLFRELRRKSYDLLRRDHYRDVLFDLQQPDAVLHRFDQATEQLRRFPDLKTAAKGLATRLRWRVEVEVVHDDPGGWARLRCGDMERYGPVSRLLQAILSATSHDDAIRPRITEALEDVPADLWWDQYEKVPGHRMTGRYWVAFFLPTNARPLWHVAPPDAVDADMAGDWETDEPHRTFQDAMADADRREQLSLQPEPDL